MNNKTKQTNKQTKKQTTTTNKHNCYEHKHAISETPYGTVKQHKQAGKGHVEEVANKAVGSQRQLRLGRSMSCASY